MFDLPLAVRKKGTPYYIVWQCAFNPKKYLKTITKEELLKFDIKKFLEDFEESLPTPARAEKELTSRFSLYLTGNLLLGVTRVFAYRGNHVLENAERVVERINQPWDTLTPEEEAAALSLVGQQRPMSPMDFDMDYMEEPRPEFGDNNFGDGRPVIEDFQDELEEPRQQLDDQQPAGAGEDDQQQGAAPGGGADRQPRRHGTRKRRAHYADGEDEDFGQRRKPRRKPARKGAVSTVARHEDITMREDVVDDLERDLLVNDDLAPLDEATLGDVYEQPIQMADDTLLVITDGTAQPLPQKEQQPSDAAPFDHDFDYQDMDAGQPPTTHDINLQTADDAANLALQSVTAQQVQQPPPQEQPEEARIDHDFDYQDMEVREYTPETFLHRTAATAALQSPAVQERVRSVSPARIIAINMIRTPEPSVPPSSRGTTPVRGAYNFEASRSATPLHDGPVNAINRLGHSRSITPIRTQPHDGDHDFDFFERPDDETGAAATGGTKQPRKKRPPRKHAREPAITYDNEYIANRDQIYLQKDLRNAKYGKFRARLDGYQLVYKDFLGPDVTVEVNDDLRDFLDERIGRLDVERARRRATRDTGSVGNRPSSRMTQLGSRPGTPFEEGHRETTPKPLEEDQQMGDPFANDFDNDFRPLTPPPADEATTARARTPPQQFHDIEYVEPIPLPDHMAHLLSPPRALPVDLFNTSSKAPFKELSCKYDHDDLYWLLLRRCVKENKVVFKFEEFANGWPRPFIAKQYHNFLLLAQLRKLLMRNVDGVFHSFILIPNDGFKKNIAKIMVHTPVSANV